MFTGNRSCYSKSVGGKPMTESRERFRGCMYCADEFKMIYRYTYRNTRVFTIGLLSFALLNKWLHGGLVRCRIDKVAKVQDCEST